jgi:hypothetical protein
VGGEGEEDEGGAEGGEEGTIVDVDVVVDVVVDVGENGGTEVLLLVLVVRKKAQFWGCWSTQPSFVTLGVMVLKVGLVKVKLHREWIRWVHL